MINRDNLVGGGNSKTIERCNVAISVLFEAYENLTTQKLTEAYQAEDMLQKMISEVEHIRENG